MKKQTIVFAAIALSLPQILTAFTVIENLWIAKGGVYKMENVDYSVPGDRFYFPDSNVSNYFSDEESAVQFTYSNLDLDEDGTANDSLDFTLTYSSTEDTARILYSGIDTGFTTINDLQITGSVTGATTDSGKTIIFDGFVGSAIWTGANSLSPLQASVEVNGVKVDLYHDEYSESESWNEDGWNDTFEYIYFSPTPIVELDNSENQDYKLLTLAGHDLQFSTVPEPSSYAILAGAFAMCMAATRRRR